MLKDKFKYSIFVVAVMVAGAIFTACNDNEPAGESDQVPVQMSAVIAGNNAFNSRGYDEMIEFSNGDKINVDAWHFRDLNGVRQSEMEYLINQEMTYDGSSWIYSPLKYWPNVVDGKLAVCSYLACPSTTDPNKCTITIDSQNGYSMTFQDSALPDDVVVAPMTEVSRDELVDGKIPLTYYHIMSQVKVRARYVLADAGDTEENYITFAGITLVGVSISGTFTGFSKDNEGNYVANWENVVYDGKLLADKTSYKINANEGFVELEGLKFCQIPHESPVYNNGEPHYSFIDVFVTYSGEDPNKYPEVNDAAGHVYKALKYYKPVAYKHEPGKTTVFDITFNGKDIIVDVSVEGEPDWSGSSSTLDTEF